MVRVKVKPCRLGKMVVLRKGCLFQREDGISAILIAAVREAMRNRTGKTVPSWVIIHL